MEGYSVKVAESSKELTGKERVAIKDITNAIKLDAVVEVGERFTIKPSYTAILEIHNEKSENKDYKVFVLVNENGEKYITSSESFITSYKDIAEEMANEEEEWGIDVYKVESKNYKGRYFITCSIA